MHVAATLDVSTCELVRELEKHARIVSISYSSEETPEGTVSLEKGIEEFWNHLENWFGFDLRKYEEV
jgi:hypothetical protein